VRKAARRELTEGVQTKYFLHGAPKTMITMGSPYCVWINTNELISSWYLLGAVCVAPPAHRAQDGLRRRVADGPEAIDRCLGFGRVFSTSIQSPHSISSTKDTSLCCILILALALGFGRIVASEAAVTNTVANLV
jgi:hypothetical protein